MLSDDYKRQRALLRRAVEMGRQHGHIDGYHEGWTRGMMIGTTSVTCFVLLVSLCKWLLSN
jgi:hypothetical protein